MAKVAAPDMPGAGHLAHGKHLDKRLTVIGRHQRTKNRLGLTTYIASGQYPPVCGDKMRRELDSHIPARDLAELLVKLAQVPMRAAHGIGVIPLAQLRMQQV